MPRFTKFLVRQSPDGAIVLPSSLRKEIGIEDADLVRVSLDDGALRIEPFEEGQGSSWARELYELFAPVRESLKDYSEQEINDAIDAAVREVRAENRLRREAQASADSDGEEQT